MKRASALLLLLSLLLGAVALSSCAAVEKETVTEGEFTFIVSKRGDTVIGIEVESPGRKAAKLNVTGKNLTFIDMNFDGYFDIRLDSLTPSLGTYECFILRPTIGKFVRSSAFSSLLSPEWDADAQTLVEEEGITYYSSGGIYCHYISVYDSGVMIRDPASEEWFASLEALRSAGYRWDDGTEMPE